jgi:hypothetical protein
MQILKLAPLSRCFLTKSGRFSRSTEAKKEAWSNGQFGVAPLFRASFRQRVRVLYTFMLFRNNGKIYCTFG